MPFRTLVFYVLKVYVLDIFRVWLVYLYSHEYFLFISTLFLFDYSSPLHFLQAQIFHTLMRITQEFSIRLTIFHSQHFKLSFFFSIFISLLNYSFKFYIIFLVSLNYDLNQVLILFFNLVAHIQNQLWRVDEVLIDRTITVSRTPVTQTHVGKPFPNQKAFCWSERGC